eukprot:1257078-Pleurochrysis_carterae.AAC.2
MTELNSYRKERRWASKTASRTGTCYPLIRDEGSHVLLMDKWSAALMSAQLVREKGEATSP